MSIATRTATARLSCLGPATLDAPGGVIALAGRRDAEPIELLLRVVAAGPPGLPMSSLAAALWPGRSPRQCLARFQSDARSLALLAGVDSAPIVLDGDHVSVDRDVLEVDSLRLEEALAPLLAPFPQPIEVGSEARAALSRALAADPVFLPGFDAPWAVAARMRIADKLVRATRRLADGDLPTRFANAKGPR